MSQIFILINTYLQEKRNYAISISGSYDSLLKDAYKKWRAASNYIANSILNEAYNRDFAIAHGTTSTSKNVELLYQKLKAKGYKIILLLCESSEENRLNAVKHRAEKQGYVQSNTEDLINKGEMFYERFPIYFKYADEILFYWIEDFSKGWIKTGEYSQEKGMGETSEEYFKKIEQAYEDHRAKHPEKNLPSINKLIQK